MTGRVYQRVSSPLGELLIVGDERGLRGLHVQRGPRPVPIEQDWHPARGALDLVAAQLGEYFAGRRAAFDLPLAADGTPWQRRVWLAVAEIPYGETLSYGELASRIGRPQAARAVGVANAANPLPIVIPCHRLVAADGALTGYAGGLERKRALLDLERSYRER